MNPPPLPPAGPLRARAVLIEPRAAYLTKRGRAQVRLRCPPRWADGIDAACAGRARLKGAAEKLRYDVAAGTKRVLRFEMRDSFVVKLERKGEADVVARTRNRDRAEGTPAELAFTIEER
jgi:hypothetical protein